MRRTLVACLTVVLALAVVGAAQAVKPKLGYPITVGEHSRQVCDVLWFQTANKPSHYTSSYYRIRKEAMPRSCSPKRKHPGATYTGKDADRTWLLKYRLGFSRQALKINGRRFSGDLRTLLLGRWSRGTQMMKLWRNRQATYRANLKRCDIGDRIVRKARAEIGALESWGWNWGPRVRIYQSFTNTYHLAWCASFAQAIYAWSGVGTFAGRSALVYGIMRWAQHLGWWHRTRHPHPGDLVVFHTWQGHMGITDTVTAGGFFSVEGNSSDRVLRRFHPWGARDVSFIHMPALDRKIKCGT